MLVIPIKEGENIDRALKRFKRAQVQKAQYIQTLRDAEDV